MTMPPREPPSVPSSARYLAVAQEIMARVAYCWLTTIGQDGAPHARVVKPLRKSLDGNGVVQFLTSGSSRKIAEIRRSPHVSLGYQYDPDLAYVSLAGAATIIEDRDEILRLWHKGMGTFFPLGADDPEVTFVSVKVERIELMSLTQKVMPEPAGRCAAVLVRDPIGNWNLLA